MTRLYRGSQKVSLAEPGDSFADRVAVVLRRQFGVAMRSEFHGEMLQVD